MQELLKRKEIADQVLSFHDFLNRLYLFTKYCKLTDNTMAKERDKQRSTKHIHKTKDRVTLIPLKWG